MNKSIHNPTNARSGSCLGMCCSLWEPVPPTVSESFTFVPPNRHEDKLSRNWNSCWVICRDRSRTNLCQCGIKKRITNRLCFASIASSGNDQSHFNRTQQSQVIREFLSFFPKTIMYKVRLNYCLHIEARSSAEAHRKAAALIRQQPGLALRGVETKDGVNRSGMPPLWKMLLLGW
jgi:hypothetical protein